MRPGCILIAAGLGADSSVSSRFDPKYWLLHPTPDMGVYDITETELQQLIQRVENNG